MRRRQILAVLGAVGFPIGAGCSGGSETGSTPPDHPTPTASPTPTTPNQQSVGHYDKAITGLIETKAVLDGWATDGFD